jgi:ABC-type nitrate/sulfonate/bicarbonate transport system permease component
MFAHIGRTTQHVVCGFLAAVIVAASLSIGAFGAQSALHEGYSVTITQLQ